MAWLTGGLVLLAAALGLLGSGPLSRTTAEVAGLMRVDYPRFTRSETVDTVTVHLESAATAGPAAHD